MSARVSSGKGSNQCYGTPWEFFNQVQKRFPCGLDLAANESNHKCATWFGPGGIRDDSFSADWAAWGKGGWLWLNPPYNNIKPWYKKCAEQMERGAKIVSLVPMDTAGWFDHVPSHAGIWHVKGRIKFDGAEQSGSKDSALHIWSPEYVGQFRVWSWREDRFLI